MLDLNAVCLQYSFWCSLNVVIVFVKQIKHEIHKQFEPISNSRIERSSIDFKLINNANSYNLYRFIRAHFTFPFDIINKMPHQYVNGVKIGMHLGIATKTRILPIKWNKMLSAMFYGHRSARSMNSSTHFGI